MFQDDYVTCFLYYLYLVYLNFRRPTFLIGYNGSGTIN